MKLTDEIQVGTTSVAFPKHRLSPITYGSLALVRCEPRRIPPAMRPADHRRITGGSSAGAPGDLVRRRACAVSRVAGATLLAEVTMRSQWGDPGLVDGVAIGAFPVRAR